MEKVTILKRIEIDAETGVLGLLFKKRIVDGDKIEKDENHRAMLEPGQDPALLLTAVNVNLAGMGEAECEAPAILDSVKELVHTPLCVARYRTPRLEAHALELEADLAEARAPGKVEALQAITGQVAEAQALLDTAAADPEASKDTAKIARLEAMVDSARQLEADASKRLAKIDAMATTAQQVRTAASESRAELTRLEAAEG